jgi:hypothetical protein
MPNAPANADVPLRCIPSTRMQVRFRRRPVRVVRCLGHLCSKAVPPIADVKIILNDPPLPERIARPAALLDFPAAAVAIAHITMLPHNRSGLSATCDTSSIPNARARTRHRGSTARSGARQSGPTNHCASCLDFWPAVSRRRGDRRRIVPRRGSPRIGFIGLSRRCSPHNLIWPQYMLARLRNSR